MNDKFIIEENQMVSPSYVIKCFSCKYKNKSYNGYKKCICEKFDNIETNRKPNEILFDAKDCEFYEKDSE